MGDYGMHSWGMGWWWIIGIILTVIVIWLIVRNSRQNKNNLNSNNKSAIDILKERYAKGEIEEEEFDNKKKNLM